MVIRSILWSSKVSRTQSFLLLLGAGILRERSMWQGRSEDIVVQKARSTINERVHARFWLTSYTFEGRRIWIGQVSRDIGVRLTSQTWNLTTHKIGPDVDFDRAYLLQDLLTSGFVERYGYVDGVGAAPASEPRENLTGDPYYTA